MAPTKSSLPKSKMSSTLRGSEQILGSGQPGDTHDTLIVAPSGCGKTELIKRALLKFWNSFNEISIVSPSLDPSIAVAPKDDDWLLFKQLPRDKKIIPYYQLDVATLQGILQQRTSEEGKSDVLVVDDCNLCVGRMAGLFATSYATTLTICASATLF